MCKPYDGLINGGRGRSRTHFFNAVFIDLQRWQNRLKHPKCSTKCSKNLGVCRNPPSLSLYVLMTFRGMPLGWGADWKVGRKQGRLFLQPRGLFWTLLIVTVPVQILYSLISLLVHQAELGCLTSMSACWWYSVQSYTDEWYISAT